MNDTRIKKGQRLSPATEFKPGQHWRPRKPHWDREWLVREYVEKGRSSGEMATEIGITETALIYWMRKHSIPRRSISEARALKHWGVSGEANPMFGRIGALNPNYVDGSSPERQRGYVQAIGRAFLRAVYLRDGYRCVKCGAANTKPKSLHAHHIAPWAGNPTLRFDLDNAVTLCRACHSWVHSRVNKEGEFLA
jgi:thymidylate synthase (FAD)